MKVIDQIRYGFSWKILI